MKCFAITNQKGGVAKTTTAVNLAAGLAKRDHRVLLIDTDPQANATIHLGFKPSGINKALDNLYLEDDLDIKTVIIQRDGFDVIPAAQQLAYTDTQLSDRVSRETILDRKLEPIKDDYDYIIIDCPPNLGFLTLNTYVAATDIIVMVQPEFFALEGLKRIQEVSRTIKKYLNPELKLSGYLMANFDGRKKQHAGIQQSVRNAFPNEAFDTIIRTNAALSNCTSKGQTIFEYNRNCKGAKDYGQLAQEVEQRYG